MSQRRPTRWTAGAKSGTTTCASPLPAAPKSLWLLRRTAEEAAAAEELRCFCEAVYTVPLSRSRRQDLWHLARSFASRQPLLVARDASPVLARLLERLHRERRFDVVHAWPITMAPYALALPGLRRVVDCDNVMTSLAARSAQALPWWLGPLARLEARRLSRYEPHVVCRANRALVVSEVDRHLLERLGAPRERLAVVPIGVDTEALAVRKEQSGSPAVLHLGGLNYPPNLEGLRWLLRRIFPRIVGQLPDCRLYVVGRDPPRDVVEAAACEPRISVVGYAREVEPYLATASLLAVPLRSGSGMRVKILQAFARGLPVVTTTLGYEGIEATPGEHMLVADDPADFAAAVVRLASDEVLAQRLNGNARRLVKAKYDWRCVGQALDMRLQHACAAAAAHACAPHRGRR